MNKEEKQKHDSEISDRFISKLDYEDSDLDALSIQDMCVLINNAKYALNNKLFINGERNMQKLIKKFCEKLVYKVKNAKVLYTIIDNNTGYPFIDENAQNSIWIFSEKQYAEDAVDYYMQQYRNFRYIEINGNNINELYEDLYLNGVNGVYIDNGYAGCAIRKEDLVTPPNYEGIPSINVPVVNPEFMLAHLKMCQELNWKVDYENREKVLDRLELEISKQSVNAKFLVPTKGIKTSSKKIEKVVLDKDTTIAIPILKGKDEVQGMPVFTDWKQFKRIYSEKEYTALVMSFKDIEEMINTERFGVAVINVGKCPLVLNENNLARIKKVLGQTQGDIIKNKEEKVDTIKVEVNDKKQEKHRGLVSKLKNLFK